jgi:hypothetical protein
MLLNRDRASNTVIAGLRGLQPKPQGEIPLTACRDVMFGRQPNLFCLIIFHDVV